ncbi:MAG: glycosyltransferase, partial [Selenomonadaceae bacterium]|nr:glycosyltransferase [Selenomonadaceae bacterium]MBR4382950.1 glycosyltransferase [Selenomonadaceae bacterium]
PACLESILIQTFTDFEVLAVDDCSTDSSVEVAESYLEKFGGRLKIISLSQNTGNPSIPRNVGLENSRGKYVLFVDNDDFLMNNALEFFYDLAENFHAEVVYTEHGYMYDEIENISIAALDKNSAPVDKPTLETADIGERVEKFLRTCYGWAPWAKFVRRDFLIDNKIFFPRVKISEDVLWSFKVICAAKKFLRVPNPLYIHRELKNSWSQIERDPVDEIKFWLDPLVKGLEYLDAFTDENNFFAQNPNYRFEVTNFFVKMQVAGMLGALEKLSRNELYEIIRREFSASRHAALIANLFVFMAYYRDKNRG